MSDTDVLIAGAGPTGLVLALSLAKQGLRPRIVEKNSGPGEASRAMVVHARTLEFYDQLGIAKDVIDSGIKVRSLRLREGNTQVAQIDIGDFGLGLSPYPFVLSYPQDDHERLLAEKLKAAGIEIEWNTELTGFTEENDGVTVTIANGDQTETCRAQYLCGCDGAHSTVRRTLNLGFPGGTYSQMFYVADVQATGETAGTDHFFICLNSRGFNLVFPIRSTGMNRLIGVVPDELIGLPEIKAEDVIPRVEAEVGIKVDKVNWFSLYHVHHRVAEHFRVGRAFLLGDAGHIHSPAGGQGMNTGIGDAMNLAWKLACVAQGRADAVILDSYEPERIAFAKSLVETTDKLFQLIVGRGVTGQIFREMFMPHALPFAMGFAAMRRGAFKMASQIRVNYHDSSLSWGNAGYVSAGDRLPWIQSANNFAPLSSQDWQLHVYGAAEQPLRDFAAEQGLPLHEFPWGEPTDQAGLERNGVYLIRPDGHLGYAHPQQNGDALESYLVKFKIKAKTP